MAKNTAHFSLTVIVNNRIAENTNNTYITTDSCLVIACGTDY